LLSPQLLTDAILGLDFLVDYKAVINFAERSITLKINSEDFKIEFIGIKETSVLEESSVENQFQFWTCAIYSSKHTITNS
jgi:hypothetical protein